MVETYDIAIIGGGIIGNSIAAHLAKENLKIAIIDPNNLGLPASKAAAGLFQIQSSELGNKELIDFCHESFSYFPKFYKEISDSFENIDLGFRKTGSIYLTFNEEDIKEKENEYNELKIKPKLSFLKKEEVFILEPKAAKNIVGGFHYPEEGYINNPKFLKAISSYCLANNTVFIESRVEEIAINKNKIQNVVLANGEIIHANKYILCNGAWANKLLKKALNIEQNLIIGVKGEIMQLGVNGQLPIKNVLLSHNGYIVPRPATNSLEEDSIIVGGTTEEIDIEKTPNIFKNSPEGILKLNRLVENLLPSCTNLPRIKTWAGIRPKTIDSLPIIDTSPDLENLILAVGHYRNGILMGPLTGKIISELILTNSTSFDINKFKCERFLSKQQLSHSIA